MPNDNPEGIGGSLTLSEAAAAYANQPEEQEAERGDPVRDVDVLVMIRIAAKHVSLRARIASAQREKPRHAQNSC